MTIRLISGALVAGAMVFFANGAGAVPVLSAPLDLALGGTAGTALSFNYDSIGGVSGLNLVVTAGRFLENNTVVRDTTNPGTDRVNRTAGGLGVLNSGEGTTGNAEIDGSGNNDIVLFSFNQLIRLISVTFTSVDGNDEFSFFHDNDVLPGNGTLVYWGSDTDIPNDNSYEFVNIWDRTYFGIGARDPNGNTESTDDFRVSALRIAYFTEVNEENPPRAVPAPAGLPLFAAGLFALFAFSRRARSSSKA